VLASVCSQYTFCRFDGDATFNDKFSASDASSLDYFHPSLSAKRSSHQSAGNIVAGGLLR
jgi:hypothetical protein